MYYTLSFVYARGIYLNDFTKGNTMNEFKPIGEVAKNLLNKLTNEYIDKICNRHIAMLLSDLDFLDEKDKESIKSHFRYFSSDIKTQILDLGEKEDEQVH
jgi:hypothetical protein